MSQEETIARYDDPGLDGIPELPSGLLVEDPDGRIDDLRIALKGLTEPTAPHGTSFRPDPGDYIGPEADLLDPAIIAQLNLQAAQHPDPSVALEDGFFRAGDAPPLGHETSDQVIRRLFDEAVRAAQAELGFPPPSIPEQMPLSEASPRDVVREIRNQIQGGIDRFDRAFLKFFPYPRAMSVAFGAAIAFILAGAFMEFRESPAPQPAVVQKDPVDVSHPSEPQPAFVSEGRGPKRK